jgi:signal transduction histidine kinase
MAGSAAGLQAQRYRALRNLLGFSLVGLGVLTVASGGLGWFMSGRVLRPVRVITETARRASERHLGERLALTGARDELKELADTFDGMLERLDAAFATQRRFVANASHELRTPLTVMRTAIDVTVAKPSPTARLDDGTNDAFEHALTIPDAALWPFGLARVHLTYGERLRRDRATSDARRHLSAARETFSQLGAAS